MPHHDRAPMAPLSVVSGLCGVSSGPKLLRNGLDIVPDVNTDRREGDIVAPKGAAQPSEDIPDVGANAGNAFEDGRRVLHLASRLERQSPPTLDRILDRTRRTAAAGPNTII